MLVSLERFWDEVAWQRRNLDEGDTVVPDPESRCFTVRYRAGGLPAERYAKVTATGTKTLFLSQLQWDEGTGNVGCGVWGALVGLVLGEPDKLRRPATSAAGSGARWCASSGRIPPSFPVGNCGTASWIWLRPGRAWRGSIWRRWANWRPARGSRAPRTGCGPEFPSAESGLGERAA